MLKKFFVVCLVVVLIQTAGLPYLHAQSPAQQQRKALEFREKVLDWGVGKKVTVKMPDGNTFKGPIAQITDDGLVVSDKDRGREEFKSRALETLQDPGWSRGCFRHSGSCGVNDVGEHRQVY